MLRRSCARVLIACMLTIWGLHAQSAPERATRTPAGTLSSVLADSRLKVDTPRQPAPRSAASQLRRRVLFPDSFELSQLTAAAGIIFSGTVARITPRRSNLSEAIQTVAVTFKVERAIRGVTAGGTLTISQWVGLWYAGQRYQAGEHVLLFLYAPSKIGLTSCVGGPIGRFSVDPSGGVLLSAEQLSFFRKDPALGGRSRVRLSDFASAVRQASEEE
jgi:hypothetical protein